MNLRIVSRPYRVSRRLYQNCTERPVENLTMRNSKNPILEMLRPGDLRMKGNVEKVLKRILSNHKELDMLIQCLDMEGDAMRMRCCDAMEKLSRQHPEWFNKYKKRLLDASQQFTRKEVRWHLAQIIPRLPLTDRQRLLAYRTFQSYLEDESSIVKTFAMQALTDLAMQDVDLLDTTRTTIKQLAKHGTPAMQSRSRQLLRTLG
jgi:hypothetical protein